MQNQEFNPAIHKTFLYPTDTTFGIGCSVFDVESIKKINQIKQRPNNKSLIILVANDAQLQQIVEVPDLAWDIIDLADKPTTIIYDSPKGLPQELVAPDNTIAIRLTQDVLCQKIIQQIKSPIISTSANISGTKTPDLYNDIDDSIKQSVDYIFPQTLCFAPKHTASAIIKLRPNGEVKIIRT